MRRPKSFRQIEDLLLSALGPSRWWPGDSPFEVMVGAILTQNTSWKNVEKAIASLKRHRALSPQAIAELKPEHLAEMIRSSGYYNQKARKLQNLVRWFAKHNWSAEQAAAEAKKDGSRMRAELLSVNGIGPETADSILCYALGAPFFVVDASTIRFLERLEGSPDLSYGSIQARAHAEYEDAFPRRAERTRRYNELHALIVRLGYAHCTKRRPACPECPLLRICRFGRSMHGADLRKFDASPARRSAASLRL